MFRPRLKLTDEWQEIPEGWVVDPPADFRMNFATGRNEARLLAGQKQKRGQSEKVQHTNNEINKLSRQREELFRLKRAKAAKSEAWQGPVTRSMAKCDSRVGNTKVAETKDQSTGSQIPAEDYSQKDKSSSRNDISMSDEPLKADDTFQKDEPSMKNDTFKREHTQLKSPKKKAKRKYHKSSNDQVPYNENDSAKIETDDRYRLDDRSKKDEPSDNSETSVKDEEPPKKGKKKKAKRNYYKTSKGQVCTVDTEPAKDRNDESSQVETTFQIDEPYEKQDTILLDEPSKTSDTFIEDETARIKRRKKKLKRKKHSIRNNKALFVDSEPAKDRNDGISQAENTSQIDETYSKEDTVLLDEPSNNSVTFLEDETFRTKRKKTKSRSKYHKFSNDKITYVDPEPPKDESSQIEDSTRIDKTCKKQNNIVLDEPSKTSVIFTEDETPRIKRNKKKLKRKYHKYRNDQVPSVDTESAKENENKRSQVEDTSERNEHISDNEASEARTEDPTKVEDIPDFPASVDNSAFSFVIDEETWDTISPEEKVYGVKRRRLCRLKGNWCKVFADHNKKFFPGCVLKFKCHNVKMPRSRKARGDFLAARAECTGGLCHSIFRFRIPSANEKKVFCRVDGMTLHNGEEINRRHISRRAREIMAEVTREMGSAKILNDNLFNAEAAELNLGNFTSVPTPAVLRQMVSELVKKEFMHSNIIYELQLLKEADEAIGSPFVREIGVDPFNVIMYSQEQIETAKRLSSSKVLDLYLDSTGSVIKNIEKQKRPYLYSAVIKMSETGLPLSVADMLSTQHTIPRITHFLNLLKRELTRNGHNLKVRKMETDFSYPLIQSSLQVFNGQTVKTYLQYCFDTLVIKKKSTQDYTVHHLCASHMIKDFIRMLKSKIHRKLNTSLRTFILKCFAALQNAASLQQATEIFRNICIIFRTKSTTDETERSIHYMEHLIKNGISDDTDFDDDEEKDQIEADELIDEENVKTGKTIRECSPFTTLFQNIADDCLNINDHQETSINAYYMPDVVEILLKSYLPLLPLWSGVMLANIDDDFIITRDSSSVVENWFKYLKINISKTKSDRRPSRFVLNLKSVIQARLRLQLYPGAKEKKSRKGKKLPEFQEEEVWKKKNTKRKGNIYHQIPPKKARGESIHENMSGLPTVMKWGGDKLTNTCTIDNALTVLNLFFKQNKCFRTHLKKDSRTVFQVLVTVMELMDEELFNEAKETWADFIQKDGNLYGDEYDQFVTFFDREWHSVTVSCCTNSACIQRRKESRNIQGVAIGMEDKFDNMQQLIQKWMTEATICSQPTVSQDQDSVQTPDTCGFRREIKRSIVQGSQVLVIRVYEHCLYKRITWQEITESPELVVNKCVFQLSGITMHKEGHYAAIVIYKKKLLWYDGLIGRLKAIPEDVDKLWFPSHTLYCKIR